jgi:hypothetical protein
MSEDVTRVFSRFDSPDLHFSFPVILAKHMVPSVDGPTMLVQVWLCCQMFCCLIICKKVITAFFVPMKL